jgi:hypothetical protein
MPEETIVILSQRDDAALQPVANNEQPPNS